MSTTDEGIDLHQLPGHEHGTGVGQVSTLGEQPRAPGCCRLTRRPASAAAGSLRLGSALMVLAGLAFIGYAVIFFVRNFTGAFLELGIGHERVDVGRAEIQAFSPDLYQYISHLHIAVSGFIAATGLATAALSWFGVRRGEVWAYVAAVAAPVLGLVVALPAHYPYGRRGGRRAGAGWSGPGTTFAPATVVDRSTVPFSSARGVTF